MASNSHKSEYIEKSPISIPPDAAEAEEDDVLVDRMIGRIVAGFRIEDRLGGGAMASIYRATMLDVQHSTDRSSHQQVALKILNTAADDILRERFRIEAQTVRSLQHPHIVQTIDSGQTDDGITYIALELIEGEDLGILLERRHQLTINESCQLLAPIADALAHAHAAGVVHRDVKPSNILLRHVAPGTPNSVQLTEMEQVVIPLLSDFGIARALDAPELTTTGRTIGTPAYMSPEQCAGKRQLDGRADLYSLGTVLYRCLVGRSPFTGTTTQILHAHVYESLTIPATIMHTLPPSVLSILQKALQKEPPDRYSDAQQFANDLSLVLEQSRLNDTSTADSTSTMPSLFAAPSLDESVAAQVLVAGPNDMVDDRPVIPWIPPDQPIAPTTKSNPKVVTKAVVNAFNRSRRPTQSSPTTSFNWGAIFLGILLATGLLFLGFLLVTTIAPFVDVAPAISGGSTPVAANREPDTPGTVAVTTTSTAENLNANPSPTSPPTVRTLQAENDPVDFANEPTVTMTPTQIISDSINSDSTPGPEEPLTNHDELTTTFPVTVGSVNTGGEILDVDVLGTWQDVLERHEKGEWRWTRWYLMHMLSEADGIPQLAQNIEQHPPDQALQIYRRLLSDPGAIFWSKWADQVPISEVEEILADMYIGLAHTLDPAEENLPVINYLRAAALVRPQSGIITTLSAMASRYLRANENSRELYVDEMVAAYRTYASSRMEDGAACAAADAILALQTLVPEQTEEGTKQRYLDACAKYQPSDQVNEPADSSSFVSTGTIYYSTYFSDIDEYAIFRTTLGEPENSVLVVRNGSQPSIYNDQLAFYSRRADSEGFSGLSLLANNNPDQRFRRYTGATEDAKESPARWNSTGTQFVFSSDDFGDDALRLYVAPTSYDSDKSEKVRLRIGEDPVWAPSGDQILYRHTGATGNEPGLFLHDVRSGVAQRITNGEDRRPIWTEDGQYIIFMRRLGERNWELFQMDLQTNRLIQLTDDPNQDGLPALSPDERYIAFASDRGGRWQLWTVPLSDDEPVSADPQVADAQLLMPIQGTLLNWLEHAIQWVN